MEMVFDIRKATNRDGNQIATLIAAVFADYPGCIFDRAGALVKGPTFLGQAKLAGGAHQKTRAKSVFKARNVFRNRRR